MVTCSVHWSANLMAVPKDLDASAQDRDTRIGSGMQALAALVDSRLASLDVSAMAPSDDRGLAPLVGALAPLVTLCDKSGTSHNGKLYHIWMEIHIWSAVKGSCFLSQVDSTLAARWFWKPCFSDLKSLHLELSREMATLLMDYDSCMYSSWFACSTGRGEERNK